MFDKTKEELVKELRDYARDMFDKYDCTNRHRLPQITVELACLGCYFDHTSSWMELTDEEKSNWGYTVEVEGLAEFAKKTVEKYGLESGQEDSLVWLGAGRECMDFVREKNMQI